jgi:hypothetical protein
VTRVAFVIVAVPSIVGAFGHAFLGERDIFPKITGASTGLSRESIRVLRLAWHTVGLTFILFGVILIALAFKPGALSKSDRWVATGISIWFAILGVAGVRYWSPTEPQPYLFLVQSALLLGGMPRNL